MHDDSWYEHETLYRRLRSQRENSPEDYLRYLCYAVHGRNPAHQQQKANEDFLQHCCHLYHAQDGKCALSGISMTHKHSSSGCPTSISIDRIDCRQGYFPGNVHLVAQWINNALNDYGQKWLLYFAHLVYVHMSLEPRDTARSYLSSSVQIPTSDSDGKGFHSARAVTNETLV